VNDWNRRARSTASPWLVSWPNAGARGGQEYRAHSYEVVLGVATHLFLQLPMGLWGDLFLFALQTKETTATNE
jgi:hypothetical protein